MEGGLVTLIVGIALILLFADVAPPERQVRAHLHSVAAASGSGLLWSGYMRGSPLLMALGLVLLAVGAAYLLLPAPAPSNR